MSASSGAASILVALTALPPTRSSSGAASITLGITNVEFCRRVANRTTSHRAPAYQPRSSRSDGALRHTGLEPPSWHQHALTPRTTRHEAPRYVPRSSRSDGALRHTGLEPPSWHQHVMTPRTTLCPAPVRVPRSSRSDEALHHTGIDPDVSAPVHRWARVTSHPAPRHVPRSSRSNGALWHTGSQTPATWLLHVRSSLHPALRLVPRSVRADEALRHTGSQSPATWALRARAALHPAPRHVPRSKRACPVLIDWARRTASWVATGRIANTAAYRLYRSQVAPPVEGDTPFATAASLPATPAVAWSDGVWYVSVSYFSGYVDSGFLALDDAGRTYRTFNLSAGALVATPPIAPGNVALLLQAGGVVRIVATYYETGANAADTWAIAYTTNGSTPATSSPSITQAFSGTGFQFLSYALPSQADGTTVKVRVQVRRSAVYSTGSTVLTATADGVDVSDAGSGVVVPWAGGGGT